MNRWHTEPISAICEYRIFDEMPCGNPATHAYPALRRGWMALCAGHAVKHADYAPPIDAMLAKGETFKEP